MTRYDQLFKTVVEEFLADLVRLVASAIARHFPLDEPRPLPEPGRGVRAPLPDPLAWGLAALIQPGELTPARQRLEWLRPIARADLDEARRFLLTNLVETYVELEEAAEEEYQALHSAEENREVEAMEMTWVPIPLKVNAHSG